MQTVVLEEPNPIGPAQLAALRAAAGAGPVLILTHDNPDPDALATGKGLAFLLEHAWGIPSRLVYSGLVARAENRAMLSRLTPEWEQSDVLPDLEAYSAIALVDTQPGAGNNRFPSSSPADIVIDHHEPVREALSLSRYVDVRPELGSSVSLLYQYCSAAGIVPDAVLATAMFYGIKTDTRALSRGTSRTDEIVYVSLLALIDHQALNEVDQAGLSQEYFRAFSRGLHAAQVYSRSVVAYLGMLDRPDLAAEMADVLIRLDRAQAALCLGQYDHILHLSLRISLLDQEAEQIIAPIIAGLGQAGGHGPIAGGQVDITGKVVPALVAEVISRFLVMMGETGEGEPLLTQG
ncbi:MAG: DHH family phosphoesterase [Chloroflexi bacterium]|nr:DHH family phosphoesterase [Chloroflexota bacterium]